MHVLPGEAVGELVGQRLAHHPRAGVEQALDRRRGNRGRFVGVEPFRAAEPGRVTRDVEDVLDGEGAAFERPLAAAGQHGTAVGAERSERILDPAGHAACSPEW